MANAASTMSVHSLAVGAEEGELRLDRWIKRHFPRVTHGRLEKLLRTGQIRVDGKRVKSGQRLEPGQLIRIPPGLEDAGGPEARPAKAAKPPLGAADAKLAQSLVLFKDDDVMALNKPSGLAVQGGTGTGRHLDGMLDALRFGAEERPRLVHRLDRDTSGVLLLARTVAAAAKLAASFRHKSARKIYWALVAGVPKPARGRIDLPLAKGSGPRGERVVARDEEEGQRAITLYAVVEAAGDRAAWLVLWPMTGRTHQLRVHCAEALGTPIVGDRKYGGERAAITGAPIAPRLHLHARSISLPHPRGGRLTIKAPLSEHMRTSWSFFGFDPEAEVDPFPVESER